MAGHAKLSPSGADRWMLCPGSMRMEEGLVDTPSRFADEGTAAHFLASECLTAGVNANVRLGHTINVCVEIATGNDVCLWNSRDYKDYVHRTSFIVDSEMVQHVQVYIDLCKKHAEEGDAFTENTLDISHLTGEEDANGTLDFHVVKATELVVIDLKYGHTPVRAVGNRQLRTYGLAAYNEYSLLQDFETVRLIISQPRVSDEPSECVLTVAELLDFAEEIKTAAKRAMSVQKDQDGKVFDIQLNPGEVQCKYCKAKLNCQKFGQEANALIAEFEVIEGALEEHGVVVTPATMSGEIDALVQSYTPDQLNDMANKVELVKQWCKAVEESRDHYLLEQNGQLADWKVVQGKEGSRSWVNDAAAEAELKRMKIREEHMYAKKVISAPQAEKLFKSKIIGERQWPKLQELITRKPGGKTVVPASDKRPALTHVTDQFDVLTVDGVSFERGESYLLLDHSNPDMNGVYTLKDGVERKQSSKAAKAVETEVDVDEFM